LQQIAGSQLPRVRQNGDMPEAGFDWRSARLRKHADYQRVYRESRRYSSASMSYFFRARPNEESAGALPRVGLTAGRVLGGAVERNRIRRRMREAVRLHLSELPLHVDVVLHPRKMVLEMEFGQAGARSGARVCERSAWGGGKELSANPIRRFQVGRDAAARGLFSFISARFLRSSIRAEGARAVFSRHVRNTQRSRLRSMVCCVAR